ncbi:MAG: chain-length determining protein [Bacteroidaceae bacterium]|nr:chain-length determining protein [Bacteroidaceae bacterium]
MNSIWSEIKKSKRLFLVTLAAAFVLSCLWVFPKPRYYRTVVTLAPEARSSSSSSSLSSLASSFGINISSQTAKSDALYPALYPEILASSGFLVDLFDIPVQTQDKEVTTTYYTYLKEHQKSSIWSKSLKGLMELFKSKEEAVATDKATDPFQLTVSETNIVKMLRKKIQCAVDKKTNVVTIQVEDQDPWISANMADSVRAHLQAYIVEYRTQKARSDVKYYEELTAKAKTEYEAAIQAYSQYQDANYGMFSQKSLSIGQKLQREQEVKYNTYNAMNSQLLAAQSKLLENTPAFTVLQGATVPVRPAGPSRSRFVLLALVLAFCATSLYVIRKHIPSLIKSIFTENVEDEEDE